MHTPSKNGLAHTFMRNAEGFLEGTVRMSATDPAAALHHLAIAVELGLKSWLLDRGYEDEWLKGHIRHDLELALFHANANGLPDIPKSTAGFIGRLGLVYQSHGFHKRPTFDPTSFLFELAHDHIDGILVSVRRRTEKTRGS
jgi:hypothetical protein